MRVGISFIGKMAGVERFALEFSQGRGDTCWLLLHDLYQLLLISLWVAKIAWTTIGCLEKFVALLFDLEVGGLF